MVSERILPLLAILLVEQQRRPCVIHGVVLSILDRDMELLLKEDSQLLRLLLSLR